MSKVTQRSRGVKDDSPAGLFEVLGYAKGKKVSVISPEPMDFRGAVAMAAGYNEKPSGITAVVVMVKEESAKSAIVASDDATRATLGISPTKISVHLVRYRRPTGERVTWHESLSLDEAKSLKSRMQLGGFDPKIVRLRFLPLELLKPKVKASDPGLVKAYLVSFPWNGEVTFMRGAYDSVMARAVCDRLVERGEKPTLYKVKFDPKRLLADNPSKVLAEVQS